MLCMQGSVKDSLIYLAALQPRSHAVIVCLCVCLCVLQLQAGAEVLVQPTAAVAREVLFELADSLLRPCSLFDVGDTLAMHKVRRVV